MGNRQETVSINRLKPILTDKKYLQHENKIKNKAHDGINIDDYINMRTLI